MLNFRAGILLMVSRPQQRPSADRWKNGFRLLKKKMSNCAASWMVGLNGGQQWNTTPELTASTQTCYSPPYRFPSGTCCPIAPRNNPSKWQHKKVNTLEVS